MTTKEKISSKDYATDQDIRWCPGCGDYSILKQMQTVAAELELKKEETVFISGIGCSSRFPYYMETYGMHSIHGRATAVASGLKSTRPELDVWIITGDGDALSIGGNHLIHLLRRNLDVNILLFNNEIYGLTKGQYSPTSPEGKVTKSTPMGSLDHPFNPLSLAIGAEATFIARTIDRDPVHLRETLKAANQHKGSSLVEIYQNCNVFNDGAFFIYSDKETKKEFTLFLEDGQPLVFGESENKGIILDGNRPKIVEIGESYSKNDLWIHDSSDRFKAQSLTRFFDSPEKDEALPRPFGTIYQEDRMTYDDAINKQIAEAVSKSGEGSLDDLLKGNSTWEIN